jgi:hypothetical protein
MHGRVLYELMAAAWPHADSDPASTAPKIGFANIQPGAAEAICRLNRPRATNEPLIADQKSGGQGA